MKLQRLCIVHSENLFKGVYEIFKYAKYILNELISIYSMKIPTDGVSNLSWWWGLSAPESYAGGSVATGRATHAGQVKG
jgi:hypothetical protein